MFLRWGSLLGLISILLGCANNVASVSTQCVVNTDQTTTFMGHWLTTPVPLAVVVNDFSSDELTAISNSISTWNAFFSASKGITLYMVSGANLAVVSGTSTRATQATVCGSSAITTTAFTNNIMIYKNTSTWTYGSSIIALTTACPVVVASSSYKKYTNAVMEINYVNYFGSGQKVPDLQSIVTHELGHMLGLNHSCDVSGSVACSSASDDYQQAVMYPSIGFDGNTGRQKQSLLTNDEERANCLY